MESVECLLRSNFSRYPTRIFGPRSPFRALFTYQHSLSRPPPCSQDMLENMEYGLAPSASTTAPGSRDVSPYGSRENLHTTVYRPAGASLKVPRSHQHFPSPPSHRYPRQGAWEPACFHGRRGVQELVGGGEGASRQWEESQCKPGRSTGQLDGGDAARVDPAEEVAAARQARLTQLGGGERRVQQHRGKRGRLDHDEPEFRSRSRNLLFDQERRL